MAKSKQLDFILYSTVLRVQKDDFCSTAYFSIPMNTPAKIIIDTDISLGTPYAEIDDAAALLVLLSSPKIDILGITTVHGNVPVELATANALRFIALAGFPQVPVFTGHGRPLNTDDGWRAFLENWQAKYGATPLWEENPQSQSAVDAIITTVEANPGEVSIISLGPLTNLALALRQAPHIAGLVKSIVAMGGSLSPSPQAEFNIRCDPEAADIVFNAEWPLLLHGLEITRQCLFTPQDFETLNNTNPALALLKKQATEWIPVVEAQGWEIGGCSLHDAVVAVAFLKHDLFTYQRGHAIQVKLEFDPERGVTLISEAECPKKLSIATLIDSSACKTFIQSQLQEL